MALSSRHSSASSESSSESNSAERGTPDSRGWRITGSGVSGGRRSPQIASSSRVAHSSTSRAARALCERERAAANAATGRRDQQRPLVLAEDRPDLRDALLSLGLARRALRREQAVVALTRARRARAAPRARRPDRSAAGRARDARTSRRTSTAGASTAATWKRTPSPRARASEADAGSAPRSPLKCSRRLGPDEGREKPRRCCNRVGGRPLSDQADPRGSGGSWAMPGPPPGYLGVPRWKPPLPSLCLIETLLDHLLTQRVRRRAGPSSRPGHRPLIDGIRPGRARRSWQSGPGSDCGRVSAHSCRGKR